MSRKRILFLCTGNSARSQMAEALVNHYFNDQWYAHSAGTEPTGYVHPFAVEVMNELGIDISANESKSVDAFRQVHFDVVMTVCDDAAEKCPLWLGSGRVLHLGFPDPAKATGSQAEKLATFRQVRDAIRHELFKTLAREAIG